MKNDTQKLITDSQKLIGARTRFGSPIPFYDDGYGPLFIHRNSMGITSIIRAQTWEDAYEIWEDAFAPEADETIADFVREYRFDREHVKIIRTKDGVDRCDQLSDYPFEKTGCSFVRWETWETSNPEAWSANELFCEAFGFRPNGPNKDDVQNHAIYAKDLNGDTLDQLDASLVEYHEISLFIREFEDEEIAFVPSVPLLT